MSMGGLWGIYCLLVVYGGFIECLWVVYGGSIECLWVVIGGSMYVCGWSMGDLLNVYGRAHALVTRPRVSLHLKLKKSYFHFLLTAFDGECAHWRIEWEDVKVTLTV